MAKSRRRAPCFRQKGDQQQYQNEQSKHHHQYSVPSPEARLLTRFHRYQEIRSRITIGSSHGTAPLLTLRLVDLYRPADSRNHSCSPPSDSRWLYVHRLLKIFWTVVHPSPSC